MDNKRRRNCDGIHATEILRWRTCDGENAMDNKRRKNRWKTCDGEIVMEDICFHFHNITDVAIIGIASQRVLLDFRQAMIGMLLALRSVRTCNNNSIMLNEQWREREDIFH